MVAILLCRLGWASILYLTLCYCLRQTFSFKCKLAIFGFNQSVLSKHVKKIQVASWLWKWEPHTCLGSFGQGQLWKKIALSYSFIFRRCIALSNYLCNNLSNYFRYCLKIFIYNRSCLKGTVLCVWVQSMGLHQQKFMHSLYAQTYTLKLILCVSTGLSSQCSTILSLLLLIKSILVHLDSVLGKKSVFSPLL